MSDSIRSIRVNTGTHYTVSIGSGLLSRCGALLRESMAPCHMAVISDSTVAPLYAQTVCDSLEKAGFSVSMYVFPAGESHKTLTTLSEILEFFAQSSLQRGDCVAALGGGVTGDMAGFAAGCYLRGIRYVQLPTTLLAAVDSSVGGKTAVDLTAGKNLAGLFWQPSAVLCDTDCLSTLSGAAFADGAAEAIKTGVLCGESLFSLLENRAWQTAPDEVIARCVSFKAALVARDETEQNERQLLNLGHTVGHAIEVCSGYTVSHGHAVAAGLAIIARAGERLGWSCAAVSSRIETCLKTNHLPLRTDDTPQALAQAALRDKKRTGNEITLIVPQRIGFCERRKIPIEALQSIIAAGLEA